MHVGNRGPASPSATRTNEGPTVRERPRSDEARRLDGRARARDLALGALVRSGSSAEGLSRATAVSPTQVKRWLHDDDGQIPVAAILTALEHPEGRSFGAALVRDLLVEIETTGEREATPGTPDVAALAAFAVHTSATIDGYAMAIADGYIDAPEAARVVGLLRDVVAKSVEVIERLERPLRSSGERVIPMPEIDRRVRAPKRGRR